VDEIKVVMFDLGNVVLKFDIRRIARKVARRYSINEDELFNFFFDSPLTKIHDEGKISSREFHKRAMKHFNAGMKFREFKRTWNNIFTENDRIIKLVMSLSKRYKIFLMSNTNKMHFDYIKSKYRIIKRFDHIFTSYEVGRLKPHPRIYREAIKTARVKPQSIVFIDDRKELVEGAQKMGIRAVQFEDNMARLRRDLTRFGVKLR